MSKPVKNEIFELLTDGIFEVKVNKKNEFFMQVLALLDSLKSGKNSKLVRISSELSQILSNKKNCARIEKAKNLDDLLCILDELNKNDRMLKIYSTESLKDSFPVLAKKKFLQF